MSTNLRLTSLLLCVVTVCSLTVASCSKHDENGRNSDNDNNNDENDENFEYLEGQPCDEGAFHCLTKFTMLVCDKTDFVYVYVHCRSEYPDSSLDCYERFCDDQEGCVSVNSPSGERCQLCNPKENDSRGYCRNGICIREEEYFADGDEDAEQEATE